MGLLVAVMGLEVWSGKYDDEYTGSELLTAVRNLRITFGRSWNLWESISCTPVIRLFQQGNTAVPGNHPLTHFLLLLLAKPQYSQPVPVFNNYFTAA